MYNTGHIWNFIRGLEEHKTYYFRAVATNGKITVHGDTIPFKPCAVTTKDSTDLAETSATIHGNLTNLNLADNAPVCFEWGRDTKYGYTTEPELKAAGDFQYTLKNLTPGTNYHYRAKVTIVNDTYFGLDGEFKTLPSTFEAITLQASDIKNNSTVLNGEIKGLSDNEAMVSFEWGFDTQYGESTEPQSRTSDGEFKASLNELTSSTDYHFRAKAQIGSEIYYGKDLTFKTLPPATISVITRDATNIACSSATLKGQISPWPEEALRIAFEYGPTSAYGKEVVVSEPPAGQPSGTPLATETVPPVKELVFFQNISGLTLGATYHYRAKVTLNGTDYYGQDKSFTTLKVFTKDATNVTATSATLNGELIGWSDLTIKLSFVWGLDEQYDNEAVVLEPVSVLKPPVTATTPPAAEFQANIDGLKPGLKYSFKAKLIVGDYPACYGDPKDFPTPDDGDSPTAWYVGPTGNDETGDGSKEKPLRTIQKAFDKADNGNTIHVLPGKYVENLRIAKDLNVLGESGKPEDAVIDGSNRDRVIQAENIKSTFKNLTIQNGTGGLAFNDCSVTLQNIIVKSNSGVGISASSSGTYNIQDCDINSNQGGIHLLGPLGKTTIQNNIFVNNSQFGIQATWVKSLDIVDNEIINTNGKGIGCEDVNAIIARNTIENASGDGIGAVEGNLTISGNTIQNCGGDGITYSPVNVPGTTGSIIGNIIRGNSGFGMSIKLTKGDIVNNLIVNNKKNGIEVGDPVAKTGGTIANNTIAGNNGGVTIKDPDSSYHVINNIIVWNGDDFISPVNATYSNIGAGNLQGEGNISKDPLFVNREKGDYHLQPGSPCLDTGTNNGAPNSDLEGRKRPFHGKTDMGCYESSIESPPSPQSPSVTTKPATDITANSVVLNGTLDSKGTASSIKVFFEWGTDIHLGKATNTQPMNSTGEFSLPLSGLSSGKTYYFRVIAFGDGVGEGKTLSFTTKVPPKTQTPPTIPVKPPGGSTPSTKPPVITTPPPQVVIHDWFVSPTGNDSTGVGTKEKPLLTIQKAIDKAAGADTIHILPGTYKENLKITKDLTITGESQNPSEVVLDGQKKGAVITVNKTNCTLKKLTVQNAQKVGIEVVESNCTLDELIIKGNSGDGISIIGNSLTVQKCQVFQNTGKGIAAKSANLVISGNHIFSNQFGIHGSECLAQINDNVIEKCLKDGINLREYALSFKKNTVRDNQGYGMYISGKLEIENNVLVKNGKTGIFIAHSPVKIDNNTITENKTGIELDQEYAEIELFNNIVWGNTGTDYSGSVDSTYSTIKTGNTSGKGNVSADPQFVNPGQSDYHLETGSAAIDSGTQDGAPDTDISGNKRPVDGDKNGEEVADMGAYEFTP